MLTDNEKEIIFNCLKTIVFEGSGEAGSVSAYLKISRQYCPNMVVPTYSCVINYISDNDPITYKEFIKKHYDID